MAKEQRRDGPFSCDISTAPTYKLGEPITVTIDMRNDSNQPYQFLIWGTPFQKELFDFFEVKYEGKNIPYDGRMVKRGDPPPEAYRVIQPGESLTESVDLSESYKIDQPGNYS